MKRRLYKLQQDASSGSPREEGRTGEHHTHKESLHAAEGSSELPQHVGQAVWEVDAAVLSLGALVLAGCHSGQEDQATEQS